MKWRCCAFAPGYLLLALQITCPSPGLAAGLAVYEQSASGAARGLAGAAAVADDASTVFYNPAGMTRLRKGEIVVALGSNFPSTTFADARGTTLAGTSLIGTTVVPDHTLYVPSVFGVWAPSENLRVGMGVNAPFGQSAKYNEGWIGRYFVLDTQLKTVNFSGNLAWRVTPALSIGGGIDYQTADTSRRSAIDFGSACLAALGPAACAGAGLLPQTQDGSINLDANSNGVGYNLGVLFEAHKDIRLGLSYRSRIAHDFSGTAAFAVPPAATFLTAGGMFRSTAASTTITLPESVSLGITAEVSPQLTLLGGLIWSRWSRFNTLIISFSNPAQPAVIEPQHWKNTYRASAGFDYRFGTTLTAHGGIAYDQSPIPAEFRYPYLPEADLLTFNAGLTWKPMESVSLTVSFSHGEYRDAPILQTSPVSGVLAGTFKRDFNTLGLQAGFRF